MLVSVPVPTQKLNLNKTVLRNIATLLASAPDWRIIEFLLFFSKRIQAEVFAKDGRGEDRTGHKDLGGDFTI